MNRWYAHSNPQHMLLGCFAVLSVGTTRSISDEQAKPSQRRRT